MTKLKKNYSEVLKYWNNMAKKHKNSPQATTNDYYLRDIEISSLLSIIKKGNYNKIADIGCGNGYSTLILARKFPCISFSGYDYSSQMISHAQEQKKKDKIQNVNFSVFDITLEKLQNKFDLIYTDRCLINLPNWNLQKIALKKIYNSLEKKGIYIMIENFVESHNNFNGLRKFFNLPEIPIKSHNIFFYRKRFLNFIRSFFKIVSWKNISSTYYIISRILYTKICEEQKIQPDYFDYHHKLGSKLPYLGDYGPINMYVMKKRIKD